MCQYGWRPLAGQFFATATALQSRTGIGSDRTTGE